MRPPPRHRRLLPMLKAIAIDPRAPRSGAHEMAHAYDFEHGQLSAQNAFRPILDRQSKTLAGMNLSDSRYRYLSTPTEVFARAYELHLLDTGRASSMTSASVAVCARRTSPPCHWLTTCPPSTSTSTRSDCERRSAVSVSESAAPIGSSTFTSHFRPVRQLGHTHDRNPCIPHALAHDR